MHKSWFAVLTVALTAAWHSPAVALPETVATMSPDSSVVRVIAEAVFAEMSARIARAALDPQPRVWTIVVPAGADSVAWARLKAHLLVALRARPGRRGEGDHSLLAVSKVAVVGDTVSARLDMTESIHCPNGGWIDNPQFFEIRAVRVEGTWGRARVKQTYDGDSVCPR